MKEADFPEGTEFYIKEFDVPLAHIPGKGWFNYFGGKPRAYNVEGLKPGNNWPAGSFDEWLEVVVQSMPDASRFGPDCEPQGNGDKDL